MAAAVHEYVVYYNGAKPGTPDVLCGAPTLEELHLVLGGIIAVERIWRTNAARFAAQESWLETDAADGPPPTSMQLPTDPLPAASAENRDPTAGLWRTDGEAGA